MKNINHGLLVSFLCFFLIVLYISCERTITKGYLSPEAEIHSFSIDSYEAEINGDSISLEFRYGTNIDELQPIIDISKGAKVTPKSGEKQDFSSPVVYKVIAEIGLVKEYTVCVSILPNTESEIEYFMVDDKKANIQGTNIMLLLDSGFKLESIKPTIQLSANASVYPKSGQAIDFNTPQKYTVTAEDGSKTVYTVTIANKIEPETEIYAFSIQEYSAEISANKIYLELPYGTDLTNLKPEISINKDASISPEIGLAQDFTKPVYYTVFSQNGSETIYEVCVVNSKNTKAHIISFVINGKHAEIIDENIELELEYGVDLSSLSPHIEISEAATISPASDVEQDFTNDVKYVVKAEDGSENEFIVNIVNKANHEAKINSFEINGKKAEIFGTEIDLELDYDADLENLSPVIKISDGASIYPESGKQIDFREQVVYTVTSAYGNKTKYKVNITVDQLLVYDETHRSVKINNKYNDKIKIGQTIMFQGLKYTVVDRAKLKSMIKNGGQQKLERLVTSRITNMDEIFRDKKIFNANISHWDVSNVKSMKGMFYNAKHFNADIGKWDVSNVTNMSLMFRDAGKFNKDISGWDVSKLTNMAEMFRNAKSFNADIGKWNVSNVTNMSLMFRDAEKFNQDIGGWNVSNVTNMNEMFRNAKNFNIYIGDWNVSKVTHMDKMFYQAKIFGQNLSGWNVVNVLHYNCVFVMTNMQGNQYPKWNHK